MSRVPGRHWLPLLLWLLVLLPATGWWLAAMLGQSVDPTNQALKAPGTTDAANRRDLAAVVPSEQVVLLAFSVPGGLPILPVDAERIASLRLLLKKTPGVVECTAPPAPEPNLALLAVSLRGDDLGKLAQDVVALAEEHVPKPMQVLETGLPLVESTLAALVIGERHTIVPWLAAMLFLAAWLLYRRIGLAVAAMLPKLLAIVWTTGIVAALGHRLDPIAVLLDPVLLTIGVATSVHFVESWRRGLQEGLDPRAAAEFASRDQRTPALLATATVMVGLLSMTTSPVPAVVDFGIRAAFGVALVQFFTFALLPGWLARQRPLPPAGEASARHVAGWLGGLGRHRTAVAVLVTAASVLAAAGLPRLRADNDPLRLLPADEPCRVDHDALAARLGGVEVFHLLARAGTPAADPARLLPFVAGSQLLPGVAGLGGPVLRSSEGDLAVPLLLRPGGSSTRSELFEQLETGARACGLDGLSPAGAAVQIARDSEALLHSLLWSTLTTLALLGVGMAVGMRSLRLGLCGMVPNLLPCLWVYGGLAWLGRPVSVATGMIGCTMLGLIVDNTLHVLHHFRHLRREHEPAHAAALALQRVGRPVTFSSGLLLVGFGTAATSHLSTTVEFAVLACTTIAAALFGCTGLLPLLLGGAHLRSQPSEDPSDAV